MSSYFSSLIIIFSPLRTARREVKQVPATLWKYRKQLVRRRRTGRLLPFLLNVVTSFCWYKLEKSTSFLNEFIFAQSEVKHITPIRESSTTIVYFTMMFRLHLCRFQYCNDGRCVMISNSCSKKNMYSLESFRTSSTPNDCHVLVVRNCSRARAFISIRSVQWVGECRLDDFFRYRCRCLLLARRSI